MFIKMSQLWGKVSEICPWFISFYCNMFSFWVIHSFRSWQWH